MRIEELWRELEQEARCEASQAWITRYALPEPSMPLLVGLETMSSSRALLLPLPASALPAKRDWPNCTGLELFLASLDGDAHLVVRLTDPSAKEIFATLAEDVARRVSVASTPQEAAIAMLARLRRWQRFLAAGSGGLSVERQRGLFGELYTLRELLAPCVGGAVAVASWRSPGRAHQDFQFGAAALEVKLTTAKQPISIRITSERQLDPAGTSALFLYVLMFDEREVDESLPEGPGESLPDIVRQLRAQLSHEAVDLFDDRLLEYGYLETHAYRYERRRFTKRQGRAYLVSAGFPRLTEANLPTGIGDVSYELSLSACEPFAIDSDQLLSVIRSQIE